MIFGNSIQFSQARCRTPAAAARTFYAEDEVNASERLAVASSRRPNRDSRFFTVYERFTHCFLTVFHRFYGLLPEKNFSPLA
jgi:hypothetical protein